MLNPKLILVYFFVIIFVSNKGYSQQTEIFVSDRKLERIFNRNTCAVIGYQHDISVLWKEDYGIKFLLKKLNASGEARKSRAISLLGKTKNPKYIKIIAPYLKDSLEHIAQSAVWALVGFRTDEVVFLLEEKLLSADKRMGGLILKILDGLNMLTKESSLSYLDSFMKSCDINKIDERIYLNKAKKIKKNILDFNQSTNENRKILIEDALFSDNNSSDPRWAMDKIRQSRDRAYLPLLRRANSHLNSMKPAYFSKTSLIKLMLYLGEKKFEERDLLMLNRIKEFNEKGREMTMELLRKPLYKGNRKGGDF